MADKVEFRKCRDFGELVGDTFLFIRQNFKALLKVFAYFCGSFVLLGMIIAIFQTLGQIKERNNPADILEISRVINMTNFDVILTIGIIFLAYTSIYVSILSFISLYVKNNNIAPTVQEVWPEFKKQYLSVLGSSVILLLIFIIGFILCLAPAIYVFPLISLFLPVMVFEEANFGYSFEKVIKLMKNQWWKTASALFIIWMVAYVGTLMALGPVIFFNMITSFGTNGGAMGMIFIIVLIVLQYLLQVLIIIPVIGASLCYFNLDEYENGTGLMERIDSLGTQKDSFEHAEEY